MEILIFILAISLFIGVSIYYTEVLWNKTYEIKRKENLKSINDLCDEILSTLRPKHLFRKNQNCLSASGFKRVAKVAQILK